MNARLLNLVSFASAVAIGVAAISAIASRPAANPSGSAAIERKAVDR
jgi:hypothetical protein